MDTRKINGANLVMENSANLHNLYDKVRECTENKIVSEELEYKNKMLTDLLQIDAKTGCVLTYQQMVEKGEDTNPKVGGGETFLHLVAKNGHEELCEAIIRNLVDKYSHSDEVLKTLGSEEDVAFMHFCNLEGKMPRNSKEQTPLHTAAIHGHFKIFKLFIDKIIDDTNWQWAQLDERQWTPLHYAAMMGHEQIGKLILDKFADHKPAEFMDFKLQSPLHIAAYRNHFNICKLLTDYQAPIELKNAMGFTPLHIAARNGNEKICELLIDRMVDKKPIDNNGLTPLHIAAFNGHFRVCKLFVDTLDATDECLNPRDHREWTPLHCAAHNGYIDVCHLLLKNVRNTKPKDSNGLTPLDVAEQRNHKSTCASFNFFYKNRANKKQYR